MYLRKQDLKALNHGLLPRHYNSDRSEQLLSAYIGNYLQDEIMVEARIRNMVTFSRFLEVAAFSNGEVVNYTNIASDSGVSVPTVKEYFQILEDTLIGRFLPAFQKRQKRRLIKAPKFYYFDIGVANYLLKRKNIEPGGEVFGKAFEHFIYHEIYAHSSYSEKKYPIRYWRTASKIEVDFILGDHEVAIEVKATEQATTRHMKGLKSFAEEYTAKQLILISMDEHPRRVGDVMVMPWHHFLDQLWLGKIME